MTEYDWLEEGGECLEGLVGGGIRIPCFICGIDGFAIVCFELELGFSSDVSVRNGAAEIRGLELAFGECAEVRDWEGIRGWAAGDGVECFSDFLVFFSH